MTARFATAEEIENWNQLLLTNPDGGNVFQMRESAAVKEPTGWKAQFTLVNDRPILVLERKIPFFGAFWYVPKGPSVRDANDLATILSALSELASERGVFAIKIEPELLASEETDTALRKNGLVPTFSVQPNNNTVLLDTAPPLDDILAGLNQKGRHAIRRAERDGVTAKPVDTTGETIAAMYDLMRETAEGQWNLRPKEYLDRYWRIFSDSGHGQMFFAYFEGQVVAASFAISIGTNGLYKDGASERRRTAYGASHLLQWEMIKWLKTRNVTRYDLCGSPPADKINDPAHPLHGVGRFKTSFNKQVTGYVGAYELPINPLRFKIWKTIGERLVLSLNARINHQEWY